LSVQASTAGPSGSHVVTPRSVRRYFTVALVALADDPVMPEPAASHLADAVSVIVAAHRAAATKWPRMNTVSRWAFAVRAIDGWVLTCTPSAS
jgi:hypothetical protein